MRVIHPALFSFRAFVNNPSRFPRRNGILLPCDRLIKLRRLKQRCEYRKLMFNVSNKNLAAFGYAVAPDK
jgi:hypothetical protein